MLLCEQNFRDVWSRNESVRAEIGQILHTHTRAAKLVVAITWERMKENVMIVIEVKDKVNCDETSNKWMLIKMTK